VTLARIVCRLVQFLTCIQFDVSSRTGIGIGIGYWHWGRPILLGIGCLIWYRSNPKAKQSINQNYCKMVWHHGPVNGVFPLRLILGLGLELGLWVGLGSGLCHALCHDAWSTSVSNNFVHVKRIGIRRNGAEPLWIARCAIIQNSPVNSQI